MISPANLKAAGIIAAVLFIFFAGFKANGYLWSARYDKLVAAHEQAIADQRQRLMNRQDRINEETEQRELGLLTELEIQRESYALLQSQINETPLVRERIIRVPVEAGTDCPVCDVVDWDAFGRLYDSAAAPRPVSDPASASGGDAAGGSDPDSG